MANIDSTTYTKLRDGSWGLRIVRTTNHRFSAGDEVAVSKKSRDVKRETIGAVLFAKDGVTLATIAQSDGTYRAHRSHGSYRSGAGSAAPVAGYSSYCTGRGGCRCFDCAS